MNEKEFEPGERVEIIELKRTGTMTGYFKWDRGPEYRVRYFVGEEAWQVSFFAHELKKANTKK